MNRPYRLHGRRCCFRIQPATPNIIRHDSRGNPESHRRHHEIKTTKSIHPDYTIFYPVIALEIIPEYDIVMDATDNLHARYLINDACVKLGKPFVYGSICEFSGQVSVFNYQNGPTYRDLFEYNDEIENFSQPLGVIGALPGIVGSLQANEAIKIILEKPGVLSGKLLTIDILNNTYLTFAIRKKGREEESLFK